MDNQVVLIGNLTADPILRTTTTGKSVCTVNFAVNKRVMNRETNQWEDKLDGYFSGSIWENHGMNVANSLKKGERAIFIGRISTRTYTRNDGTEGTAVEVDCSEIAPSLKWGSTSFTKGGRGGAIPQGQNLPPVPDYLAEEPPAF